MPLLPSQGKIALQKTPRQRPLQRPLPTTPPPPPKWPPRPDHSMLSSLLSLISRAEYPFHQHIQSRLVSLYYVWFWSPLRLLHYRSRPRPAM